MYVRLKKRKWKDGTDILDIVLVKSYREGKKVKHRFVKNLGYFKPDVSDEDRKYGMAEYRFLQNVRWGLERLNLDLSEREKIEQMALKKFQDITKCSAYKWSKKVVK